MYTRNMYTEQERRLARRGEVLITVVHSGHLSHKPSHNTTVKLLCCENLQLHNTLKLLYCESVWGKRWPLCTTVRSANFSAQ